jgi:predicted chitinase
LRSDLPASPSISFQQSECRTRCGIPESSLDLALGLNFQSGSGGGVMWAMGCDWKNNDMGSAQIRAEDCGGKCLSTNECTHFTWTSFNGGTCWMKKGSVQPSDALSTDPSMVCGYRSTIPLPGPDVCSVCPTRDQFNRALTNNGYPAPTDEQFNNFVAGLVSKAKVSSKTETAMLLTNLIHESGGLKFKAEIACGPNCVNCPDSYKTNSDIPGQRYCGRGYIQLSWHYNYIAASRYLFGDDRLTKDANQVATNDRIAWDTAFWFWAINVHPNANVQKGMFGATTKIINGNECNGIFDVNFAKKRFILYKVVYQAFNLGGSPIENGCYN